MLFISYGIVSEVMRTQRKYMETALAIQIEVSHYLLLLRFARHLCISENG